MSYNLPIGSGLAGHFIYSLVKVDENSYPKNTLYWVFLEYQFLSYLYLICEWYKFIYFINIFKQLKKLAVLPANFH